jgi:transposase
VFRLSPGNAHDAPEGRELLDEILSEDGCYILMDKAYEGDDTRLKAMEQGFVPVVPPKSNRKELWEYDRELYKRRNEIERYFLRLKRFRRVFTRYDKLDIIYTGVIVCAMLFDAILM